MIVRQCRSWAEAAFCDASLVWLLSMLACDCAFTFESQCEKTDPQTMHQMNTKISLRSNAVWSVFVVHMIKLCVLGYPNWDHQRFRSDCANAQTDLNLRITKPRLFKYIENLTTKKGKYLDKKIKYLLYFCSKHRLWVLVRTASARRS